MNRHLPAYTAALPLAACSLQATAGACETIEARVSPELRPKPSQLETRKTDKTKIARNMEAWDKLMAQPDQQPLNSRQLAYLKELNDLYMTNLAIKAAENNRMFPKRAMPLKQILPISDKDIVWIHVLYSGMSSRATNEKMLRFFQVGNNSGYIFGKTANFLVEPHLGISDAANFDIPPERFAEFVGMLNNIRAWRYPNPRPEADAIDNNLMIGICYKNGKVFGLGIDGPGRYLQYSKALIAPDLSPLNENYVFIYVSLRDVVELMQYLDDRVPVFLYRYNYATRYDELSRWKEILQNGQ